MATSLQVNASTQQAVGAFNALAQSIAAATAQFNSLNRAMASGNTVARGYSGQITAINTAFNSLTHILGGVYGAVQRIGAGTQFVFSSIVKELDKLQGFNAIMLVTTKSADGASQSYEFLRKTADKLGVQFDALTSNYAKLLASMPPTEAGLRATQNAFLGIALAARTLHASNQDTQLMFYAITQIASKGAVSMEELRRQLGEKLPGALQIAARALNTTPELLEKAIRTGTVNSAKFLEYFGSELIRTFQEPAERASTSVSASINRLTNVWVDFVKVILDSGAGQSIANIFDAIREKLSDPYVIEHFAKLVKELSDRFTDFVKNLTVEDVRSGFDTLANGLSVVVSILGNLVSLLQWIINNGKTAGAIIGGMAGAAAGVVAGPYGALAGAVGGAAAGAYAGSQLQSTPEQRAASSKYSAAQLESQAREQSQQGEVYVQMMSLFGEFKGLKTLKGLENLLKAENLNTRTVEQLNQILKSPVLKTDADKASAVHDLAKFGTVLSPRGSLESVLGGAGSSKNRRDPVADDLMRAVGLDPKFYEHLRNYQTSFKSGKLDTEQYVTAVEKLIQKQPFAIELAKQQREEQERISKEATDFVTYILKGVEAKENLVRTLDEELRITQLLGPYAEIEADLLRQINDLKSAGAVVTGQEVDLLREKLRIIDSEKRIQSAAQGALNGSVYRNRDTGVFMQGLDRASEFGASNAELSNYVVGRNPQLFSGTEEYYTFQKQQADDLILYFDGLRQRNLISEETYTSRLMMLQANLNAERLQDTTQFFGNLATLASSGNSKLAAIGKAAAMTQAVIDGVLAVQKALASAPPPYNFALAAAVGVAAAANVAKIASSGYMSGGYTGNGGRDEIAGVVHGQEYVVNASATARNRAALEAMNAGGVVGGGNQFVEIVVNNNAPGTAATATERDTPNGKQIEVTIEEVVAKSVRRGGRIADAMESQYGLNRSVGAAR